ncbi:class I SAM-dependent methyltransferase [Brevibacillus parabrevis]
MKKGEDRRNDFIPALRFHWLTSIYDPILRWTMQESSFKKRLIQQIQLRSGQRVLDLGCGTGTLTLLIKQSNPNTQVFGLDADPKVLEIARGKNASVGMDIIFDQGMSFELPYPDHSFDRVVSSLMFHHLSHESKKATLDEIYRVLKPDGELHLADWGKPHNQLMRIAFLSIQILDGFTTTRDNVDGKLPELINHSGFQDVEETYRFMTLYGTLSLYQAKKVK